MAKPAEKIGRGPCPQCTQPVMFKRSSGGKVTYACDACDTSGYAEPTGSGQAKWLASIKAPAPAGQDTTIPSNTLPAPKASGFSLASL